jgi:DNA polymerase I-like protein with 3'-5' exonuclease and polymerase domains
MENSFTEALAWIPQSTVALVITKAMNQLHLEHPWVEQLFQVHDSLVVQVPACDLERGLRALHQCMHQVIPYPDPLVIPSSADISSSSWGDVKLVEWPKACVIDIVNG